MKLITALIALALVGYGAVLFIGESKEFGVTEAGLEWMPLEQGVAAAKQKNKTIVVDVYTDWCGWCKKMDKEVYTHEGVVKILNKEFVAIKLNAESSNKVTFNGSTMSQSELARSLGVTGYPTTVFFTSDARLITTLPGYVAGEEFSHILTFIGEEHFEKMSYEEFRKRPDTQN